MLTRAHPKDPQRDYRYIASAPSATTVGALSRYIWLSGSHTTHHNFSVSQLSEDAVTESRYMEVGDRFLVPVKPTNKRGVGIVHDASRTGRTVYVEPAQVQRLRNAERSSTVPPPSSTTAMLNSPPFILVGAAYSFPFTAGGGAHQRVERGGAGAETGRATATHPGLPFSWRSFMSPLSPVHPGLPLPRCPI